MQGMQHDAAHALTRHPGPLAGVQVRPHPWRLLSEACGPGVRGKTSPALSCAPPLRPQAPAFCSQIYQYLEPLYNDYRKLRVRNEDGTYALSHVDEVVDLLLRCDTLFDTSLPRLPYRQHLEQQGMLEARVSVLEEDFEEALREAEQEAEQAAREADKILAAVAPPPPPAQVSRGAREAGELPESRRGDRRRSRTRSRSRDRGRDRRRSRSRSPRRDDRYRDRDRAADRGRYDRDRERDRDRRRSRSRSRSRDRDHRDRCAKRPQAFLGESCSPAPFARPPLLQRPGSAGGRGPGWQGRPPVGFPWLGVCQLSALCLTTAASVAGRSRRAMRRREARRVGSRT